MSSRPLEISRSLILGALVVGAAGLVATGVGVALWPQRALISYLFGFIFWFSLALGAFLALLAFHATGARWIAPFRRSLELLSVGVVLAAPFVIPILVATPTLYPWARPGWGPSSPDMVFTLRGLYLRRDFFTARTLLYLACWIPLLAVLLRASLRLDEERSPALAHRMRVIGAASMPLVVFSATFAIFDWLMSLTPEWSSELYALYVLTGGFVGAFAVLCLVASKGHQHKLLPTVTDWHFHSLGKLLFALVCFWAYLAYDQYMLIWIANEPKEVAWYLARTEDGWRPFFLALASLHFVIPFFVLLPKASKISPPILRGVCWLLLLAHVLDVYWIVIPSSGERMIRWTDVASFIGFGGVFTALTLWRFAVTPFVASGDPELANSPAASG